MQYRPAAAQYGILGLRPDRRQVRGELSCLAERETWQAACYEGEFAPRQYSCFAIPGYLYSILKYPIYLLWRVSLFPGRLLSTSGSSPVLPALPVMM